MSPEQPTHEQILVLHAERQTIAAERQVVATETIRNYVFYLLLVTMLGLLVGGAVAIDGF